MPRWDGNLQRRRPIPHPCAPPPPGEPKYESNARFVRWSDGSLQLLLGDEVLDTTEQDMAMDHHYLFVRHQGLIQVCSARLQGLGL